MKVYQINYNLRKQSNYDELYKKIKSYSNWCHPLNSCWIITSNKTALEIQNDLTTILDHDDSLLITRLQNEAAWCNLDFHGSKVKTDWLKINLSCAT
ncbi:hypothetical protein [Acinetobacter nectaris]|uniref:hypothetical protein n=1 Tax=Acinetobacter nectaris TaxID=1219382 RepID=UPI001F1C7247|nr:hypothetical protein [Acinetobacter nectaris]MCF9046592.1 hypothetical protein [Acinetobacter nectaris]